METSVTTFRSLEWTTQQDGPTWSMDANSVSHCSTFCGQKSNPATTANLDFAAYVPVVISSGLWMALRNIRIFASHDAFAQSSRSSSSIFASIRGQGGPCRIRIALDSAVTAWTYTSHPAKVRA